MAKQISYKRFLKLLSQSPRKWYLRDGAIRIKRTTRSLARCPLTFVAKQTGLWVDAGFTKAVVCAADNRVKGSIRRDLLKACGLAEKK